MLLLFLLSLVICVFGIFLYWLNYSKIQTHKQSLRQIHEIKEKLHQQLSDGTVVQDTFKLSFPLPDCTGVYVLSEDLSTTVWQQSANMNLDPDMMTQELKHKILVRARSGGGLLTLPWKQRLKKDGHSNNNSELHSITVMTFILKSDQIALIAVCSQ